MFFDKPHGQVGRALNGLELHALPAIEFLPDAPAEPGMVTTTVALINAGFESGSQSVALPATVNAISLTFFMHIDTEEQGNTAPGYILHAIDLAEFKGKTIRIQLEATEDTGSITSFVLDDFAVVVEVP